MLQFYGTIAELDAHAQVVNTRPKPAWYEAKQITYIFIVVTIVTNS